MSSIMRWRSGLTRVSTMGGSCLEVRFSTHILGQDPLIGHCADLSIAHLREALY
jgi:hypothetical protein